MRRLALAGWLTAAAGCVDKSPPPLWPSPPPPSLAQPIGRPTGWQVARTSSDAPPPVPVAPEEPTVWSEPPAPLVKPPPGPAPAAEGEPGKPRLREKLQEKLEEARDKLEESREKRDERAREKQQKKLEKRRRTPVPE